MRRGLALMTGLLIALALGSGSGSAQTGGPMYEPNFAGQITSPRPCALEKNHGRIDPYEKRVYKLERWSAPDYERYPGSCERLRFAYGPIVVKPGQNDVLVGPVTIEKPSRDGYIARFVPNLVRADGKVPPVEQIHLHHGTWLAEPEYGSGPFFASGEEKTIAPFPRGYGMPIKAADQWQLLYMVHSAVPNPMEVYITYDVDFIPKSEAAKWDIKPAYPVWFDVRPSGYPVFNVQRQFGGKDNRCTWPKEKCAHYDPYGKKFIGQGEPGNGKGTDYTFPNAGESLGKIENFQGGTLIGIGGHLHPGGIQNEIDLVRGKRKTRIYTGKANYWSHKDPTKVGAPPDSWDFSMAVSGLPTWGVRVKPGDRVRSNATYDTAKLASYENMGIAVALLAPDTPQGKPIAPGVDPFRAKKDSSSSCNSPRTGRLCTKGFLTHGHYSENGNHRKPGGHWTLSTGGPANDVGIVDFQYLPGDLSSGRPIPRVKLNTKLRFTNLEGAGIYHTVTSCAFPCLGETTASFPVPDGKTSKGRPIDLDSSELGIGAPYIGPTSQTLSWSIPVTAQTGFKPGEKVTYFCRVHPFMRGAFEVSK